MFAVIDILKCKNRVSARLCFVLVCIGNPPRMIFYAYIRLLPTREQGGDHDIPVFEAFPPGPFDDLSAFQPLYPCEVVTEHFWGRAVEVQKVCMYVAACRGGGGGGGGGRRFLQSNKYTTNNEHINVAILVPSPRLVEGGVAQSKYIQIARLAARATGGDYDVRPLGVESI